MKKVKQANGYTIYASTARDVANGDAASEGEYAIYISADIREYGREYSDPEWEGIETLEIAMELCSGSNYARAKAIAEEHNDSTIGAGAEEVKAIERALDAGVAEDRIDKAIEALQEAGFSAAHLSEVFSDDGIDTYVVVAGDEDADGEIVYDQTHPEWDH